MPKRSRWKITTTAKKYTAFNLCNVLLLIWFIKPMEKLIEFAKQFARIEKIEGISDKLEAEIESIGDACFNMARVINRKHSGGEDFTEEQYERIDAMMKFCDQMLSQMKSIIEGNAQVAPKSILKLEFKVNDYRKMLKNLNVDDINANRYSYQLGVHYMDLINDCEKLGDYVVNVVEAHVNHKLTK